MDKQIKISANITLDSQKEADIIEQVESLIANRQLSNFVTNLIKFGLENPSLLEKANIDRSQVLMVHSRTQFFADIKHRIEEMDKRIYQIEAMALNTYELSKFGKAIGLKEKTENCLRAEFILKRQLREIKSVLGYSDMDFSSNWSKVDAELKDIEEKADTFMEYVILHYDGIIQEIVNEDSREVVRGSTHTEKEDTRKENIGLQSEIKKTEITKPIEEIKENEILDKAEEKPLMDYSALEDFFG